MIRCAHDEVLELRELLLRDRDELPGGGVFLLGALPGGHRIAAVQPGGDAAEFVLRRLQLAHRNRQQPIGTDRDAFVELELLLELLPAQPEGSLAARRQILFQILDQPADRVDGFGRGIRQIAQQVQVAQVAERAREVVVDESQGAPEALQPHLHVDAGRILDVVAGRLDDPRDLPELRVHPARPLGKRRVVEQHLTRQARRQDLGVVLEAPLPGPDLFQLEQPGSDVRFQCRSLEPFGVGQARGIDCGQPAGEATQGADLSVNGLTAEVLEEVVVQVDAVECGIGRVGFVEIREVLVDEVRKGFG